MVVTTRRRSARGSTQDEDVVLMLPLRTRRRGKGGLERLTDLPVDVLLEVRESQPLFALLQVKHDIPLDYAVFDANRFVTPCENEQTFSKIPAQSVGYAVVEESVCQRGRFARLPSVAIFTCLRELGI